jgi:hypothetical protein
LIKSSLLEDAVEDALITMLEEGHILPDTVDIHYDENEWEKVERFHRLRTTKSGKIGLLKDRFPFVRMKPMNINVNLMPYNPTKKAETIH